MDYYRIESRINDCEDDFIDRLSAELGEELRRVSLEDYLSADFALLYVASGGSEGIFRETFPALDGRSFLILTSGENNSLAASMEILAFLRSKGGRGEILHGSLTQISVRLRSLRAAFRAKASLRGARLGCIGVPSDWLISSTFDADVLREKLGVELVNIPMDELIEEYNKGGYVENRCTAAFLACGYDAAETEKSLQVYGAFKRLVERYSLAGVTVRCFDLLDSIRTTGCLALSILNDEGIYAGCEGDIPSLLSMAILGEVTGEPTFMCNPCSFNTDEGTAIFAHCTVPTSMLHSYVLNTHFESGIGVAVQGSFDEGACTVFKCAGDLSRFFAKEGSILDLPFSPNLCRTQIRVKLDDFSYFLTEPISNHHILCRGAHQKALETFFEIL